MGTLYPAANDTNTSLYDAKNGAETTLNSTIDNVVTSITVANLVGYPASGIVTIDAEAILYTSATAGVNGTFNLCTRGYDGTTAAGHAANAKVRFSPVADHHNVLKDAIIALEKKVGNNTGGASATTMDAAQLASGSSASITALTTSGLVTAVGLRDSRGPAGGNVPFIWLKVNGDGTTNKVSFTSIPGLSIARLSWDARTTSATNGEDSIALQFNTDTTNTYFSERVNANTATVVAVDGGGLVGSLLVGYVPGGGTTANFYGHGHTELANYANTTNIKGAVGISQIPKATGATNSYIEFIGGNWNSTAAITRIDVICSAGFWTPTSAFYLQLV
jgi:hypothetical protein